jgi:periplasmic divalent cation tolerance protein
MSIFLVLSTAGSEKEGQRIGKALVEKRLAACVNVLPGITSFFIWEGKICREREVLLLIKTTRGRLKQIESEIKEIHSYSLPEVLFAKVEGGEKRYLGWIQQAVGKMGGKGVKKNY